MRTRNIAWALPLVVGVYACGADTATGVADEPSQLAPAATAKDPAPSTQMQPSAGTTKQPEQTAPVAMQQPSEAPASPSPSVRAETNAMASAGTGAAEAPTSANTPQSACGMQTEGQAGCTNAEPSAASPEVPPAPETTETAEAPTPRSGGLSTEPQTYDDPDLKCYEIRAHAAGDMTAPFEVQAQSEVQTNFRFMLPFEGTMYARSLRALIDNKLSIHHALLFQETGPVANGAIEPSASVHGDAQMMHAWAPGAEPIYFDPDVGLEVSGNVGYTMELHHLNLTDNKAIDSSGFELCVTPSTPKHVAAYNWLGTVGISGTSATGVCRHNSREPIHLLAIGPHMHLKGRHMKVDLQRAAGAVEVLHDADYDFHDQTFYLRDDIVMPGDSIKTQCTYSAPATFGPSSSDEMCYLFTLSYPKLALTNGNAIGTAINGPNSCVE